jgi:hypothetical protein
MQRAKAMDALAEGGDLTEGAMKKEEHPKSATLKH